MISFRCIDNRLIGTCVFVCALNVLNRNMYILLVFFMIFSPSLEASIVITVPPNVHVSTIKNPFPFYQEEESEVKQMIQKWLQKRAPVRNHYLLAQERADMKKIEPIVKSDLMKKIVTVCTHAVANTKDNAVASVFSCVIRAFEKEKS